MRISLIRHDVVVDALLWGGVLVELAGFEIAVLNSALIALEIALQRFMETAWPLHWLTGWVHCVLLWHLIVYVGNFWHR